MPSTYFTANTLRFLRDLKKNNNREWFAANKARYEDVLRDPFLHLIADLAEPLAKISPHFRADARAQGGSLFRIYRDVRFSANKQPYKAWAGARFFHERARQVEAPSFYLHIAPADSFVGGGKWHPEPPTVKRIRDFIVDNPASWKKAVHNKRFQERFIVGGDTLSRPPRGYDPGHELITDIKRKDFVAMHELSDAQITSSELKSIVIENFKALAPMIDYLCAALDLEF